MIKKIVRLYSVVLLVVCLAFPDVDLLAATLSDSSLIPTQLIQKIESQQLGYCRVIPGTNQKTVFLIEDAHDSPEAQRKISEILQLLTTTGKVKTVYEEGYDGEVPVEDYFSILRTHDNRRRLSDYLLDQMRIGGAEYALINARKKFRLVGAEEWKFYLANLRAAQKAKKVEADVLLQLNQMQSLLREIWNKKPHSEVMRLWEKADRDASFDSARLFEFLKRLQAVCPECVTSERAPLLSKLLNPKLSQKMDQTQFDLIRQITQEIQNLRQWFLENKTSVDERQMLEWFSRLEGYRRLASLQLTLSEFKASNQKAFSTRDFANWISVRAPQNVALPLRWERAILFAQQFYDLAIQRENAVEKRMQQFSSADEDQAAVVFGGFHTEGLSASLQKQGIAQVIVTPRIQDLSVRHQQMYRSKLAKNNVLDKALRLPSDLVKAHFNPPFRMELRREFAEFGRTQLRSEIRKWRKELPIELLDYLEQDKLSAEQKHQIMQHFVLNARALLQKSGIVKFIRKGVKQTEPRFEYTVDRKGEDDWTDIRFIRDLNDLKQALNSSGLTDNHFNKDANGLKKTIGIDAWTLKWIFTFKSTQTKVKPDISVISPKAIALANFVLAQLEPADRKVLGVLDQADDFVKLGAVMGCADWNQSAHSKVFRMPDGRSRTSNASVAPNAAPRRRAAPADSSTSEDVQRFPIPRGLSLKTVHLYQNTAFSDGGRGPAVLQGLATKFSENAKAAAAAQQKSIEIPEQVTSRLKAFQIAGQIFTGKDFSPEEAAFYLSGLRLTHKEKRMLNQISSQSLARARAALPEGDFFATARQKLIAFYQILTHAGFTEEQAANFLAKVTLLDPQNLHNLVQVSSAAVPHVSETGLLWLSKLMLWPLDPSPAAALKKFANGHVRGSALARPGKSKVPRFTFAPITFEAAAEIVPQITALEGRVQSNQHFIANVLSVLQRQGFDLEKNAHRVWLAGVTGYSARMVDFIFTTTERVTKREHKPRSVSSTGLEGRRINREAAFGIARTIFGVSGEVPWEEILVLLGAPVQSAGDLAKAGLGALEQIFKSGKRKAFKAPSAVTVKIKIKKVKPGKVRKSQGIKTRLPPPELKQVLPREEIEKLIQPVSAEQKAAFLGAQSKRDQEVIDLNHVLLENAKRIATAKGYVRDETTGLYHQLAQGLNIGIYTLFWYLTGRSSSSGDAKKTLQHIQRRRIKWGDAIILARKLIGTEFSELKSDEDFLNQLLGNPHFDTTALEKIFLGRSELRAAQARSEHRGGKAGLPIFWENKDGDADFNWNEVKPESLKFLIGVLREEAGGSLEEMVERPDLYFTRPIRFLRGQTLATLFRHYETKVREKNLFLRPAALMFHELGLSFNGRDEVEAALMEREVLKTDDRNLFEAWATEVKLSRWLHLFETDHASLFYIVAQAHPEWNQDALLFWLSNRFAHHDGGALSPYSWSDWEKFEAIFGLFEAQATAVTGEVRVEITLILAQQLRLRIYRQLMNDTADNAYRAMTMARTLRQFLRDNRIPAVRSRWLKECYITMAVEIEGIIKKNYQELINENAWLDKDGNIIWAEPPQLALHQHFGIQFMEEKPKQGVRVLADQVGVGKTFTAAVASRALGMQRTLVMASKDLLQNLESELLRLFGDEVEIINLANVNTVRKHRLVEDVIAAEKSQSGKPVFVLVNYEALREVPDQTNSLIGLINQWGPELVVADEAHRLRNGTTQETRGFFSIRNRAKGQPLHFFLTGTPIVNTVGDIWPFLHRMDPVAYPSLKEFEKKVAASALDLTSLYANVLRRIMLRRTREQVLADLPRVEKVVRVETGQDPEQQALYDKELLAYDARKDDSLARFERLRQIVLDLELLKGKNLKHAMPPKYRKAIELVRDMLARGEQVVIFSRYIRVVERLQEILAAEFGEDAVHAISSEEKNSTVRFGKVTDFQNNPKKKIFIATYGTGSEGITLNKANNVIFMDLPLTPARMEQAVGRLTRMGQKQTVKIFALVAAGTIDERIWDILNSKDSLFKTVIEARLQAADRSLQQRIFEEEVYQKSVAARLREQLQKIYQESLAGRTELAKQLWSEFARDYSENVEVLAAYPIAQAIFLHMLQLHLDGKIDLKKLKRWAFIPSGPSTSLRALASLREQFEDSGIDLSVNHFYEYDFANAMLREGEKALAELGVLWHVARLQKDITREMLPRAEFDFVDASELWGFSDQKDKQTGVSPRVWALGQLAGSLRKDGVMVIWAHNKKISPEAAAFLERFGLEVIEGSETQLDFYNGDRQSGEKVARAGLLFLRKKQAVAVNENFLKSLPDDGLEFLCVGRPVNYWAQRTIHRGRGEQAKNGGQHVPYILPNQNISQTARLQTLKDAKIEAALERLQQILKTPEQQQQLGAMLESILRELTSVPAGQRTWNRVATLFDSQIENHLLTQETRDILKALREKWVHEKTAAVYRRSHEKIPEPVKKPRDTKNTGRRERHETLIAILKKVAEREKSKRSQEAPSYSAQNFQGAGIGEPDEFLHSLVRVEPQTRMLRVHPELVLSPDLTLDGKAEFLELALQGLIGEGLSQSEIFNYEVSRLTALRAFKPWFEDGRDVIFMSQLNVYSAPFYFLYYWRREYLNYLEDHHGQDNLEEMAQNISALRENREQEVVLQRVYERALEIQQPDGARHLALKYKPFKIAAFETSTKKRVVVTGNKPFIVRRAQSKDELLVIPRPESGDVLIYQFREDDKGAHGINTTNYYPVTFLKTSESDWTGYNGIRIGTVVANGETAFILEAEQEFEWAVVDSQEGTEFNVENTSGYHYGHYLDSFEKFSPHNNHQGNGRILRQLVSAAQLPDDETIFTVMLEFRIFSKAHAHDFGSYDSDEMGYLWPWISLHDRLNGLEGWDWKTEVEKFKQLLQFAKKINAATRIADYIKLAQDPKNPWPHLFYWMEEFSGGLDTVVGMAALEKAIVQELIDIYPYVDFSGASLTVNELKPWLVGDSGFDRYGLAIWDEKLGTEIADTIVWPVPTRVDFTRFDRFDSHVPALKEMEVVAENVSNHSLAPTHFRHGSVVLDFEQNGKTERVLVTFRDGYYLHFYKLNEHPQGDFKSRPFLMLRMNEEEVLAGGGELYKEFGMWRIDYSDDQGHFKITAKEGVQMTVSKEKPVAVKLEANPATDTAEKLAMTTPEPGSAPESVAAAELNSEQLLERFLKDHELITDKQTISDFDPAQSWDRLKVLGHRAHLDLSSQHTLYLLSKRLLDVYQDPTASFGARRKALKTLYLLFPKTNWSTAHGSPFMPLSFLKSKVTLFQNARTERVLIPDMVESLKTELNLLAEPGTGNNYWVALALLLSESANHLEQPGLRKQIETVFRRDWGKRIQAWQGYSLRFEITEPSAERKELTVFAGHPGLEKVEIASLYFDRHLHDGWIFADVFPEPASREREDLYAQALREPPLSQALRKKIQDNQEMGHDFDDAMGTHNVLLAEIERDPEIFNKLLNLPDYSATKRLIAQNFPDLYTKIRTGVATLEELKASARKTKIFFGLHVRPETPAAEDSPPFTWSQPVDVFKWMDHYFELLPHIEADTPMDDYREMPALFSSLGILKHGLTQDSETELKMIACHLLSGKTSDDIEIRYNHRREDWVRTEIEIYDKATGVRLARLGNGYVEGNLLGAWYLDTEALAYSEREMAAYAVWHQLDLYGPERGLPHVFAVFQAIDQNPAHDELRPEMARVFRQKFFKALKIVLTGFQPEAIKGRTDFKLAFIEMIFIGNLLNILYSSKSTWQDRFTAQRALVALAPDQVAAIRRFWGQDRFHQFSRQLANKILDEFEIEQCLPALLQRYRGGKPVSPETVVRDILAATGVRVSASAAAALVVTNGGGQSLDLQMSGLKEDIAALVNSSEERGHHRHKEKEAPETKFEVGPRHLYLARNVSWNAYLRQTYEKAMDGNGFYAEVGWGTGYSIDDPHGLLGHLYFLSALERGKIESVDNMASIGNGHLAPENPLGRIMGPIFRIDWTYYTETPMAELPEQLRDGLNQDRFYSDSKDEMERIWSEFYFPLIHLYKYSGQGALAFEVRSVIRQTFLSLLPHLRDRILDDADFLQLSKEEMIEGLRQEYLFEKHVRSFRRDRGGAFLNYKDNPNSAVDVGQIKKMWTDYAAKNRISQITWIDFVAEALETFHHFGREKWEMTIPKSLTHEMIQSFWAEFGALLDAQFKAEDFFLERAENDNQGVLNIRDRKTGQTVAVLGHLASFGFLRGRWHLNPLVLDREVHRIGMEETERDPHEWSPETIWHVRKNSDDVAATVFPAVILPVKSVPAKPENPLQETDSTLQVLTAAVDQEVSLGFWLNQHYGLPNAADEPEQMNSSDVWISALALERDFIDAESQITPAGSEFLEGFNSARQDELDQSLKGRFAVMRRTLAVRFADLFEPASGKWHKQKDFFEIAEKYFDNKSPRILFSQLQSGKMEINSEGDFKFKPAYFGYRAGIKTRQEKLLPLLTLEELKWLARAYLRNQKKLQRAENWSEIGSATGAAIFHRLKNEGLFDAVPLANGVLGYKLSLAGRAAAFLHGIGHYPHTSFYIQWQNRITLLREEDLREEEKQQAVAARAESREFQAILIPVQDLSNADLTAELLASKGLRPEQRILVYGANEAIPLLNDLRDLGIHTTALPFAQAARQFSKSAAHVSPRRNYLLAGRVQGVRAFQYQGAGDLTALLKGMSGQSDHEGIYSIGAAMRARFAEWFTHHFLILRSA